MSQDVSHRGRGRVARSGANLRGHRGSRKRHVLPPVNNRRSHGGVEESVSRCSRRGGCMTRVCVVGAGAWGTAIANLAAVKATVVLWVHGEDTLMTLSLIHISEPTRLGMISYAVFCLKKKKKNKIDKTSRRIS